jgi:hypothetical protein
MGARIVSALLGLWLYLSAFAWPHTPFQRANAWIAGIVAVTAAVLGLRNIKTGRYVNAVLGAWLIVSALLMPAIRPATLWNHLIVGFALVLFAMASSLPSLRRRTADV